MSGDLTADLSDDSPSAMPAIPIRFCRQCGAETPLRETSCVTCNAHDSVRQLRQRAASSSEQEKRQLRNAIGLYGALLAVVGISSCAGAVADRPLDLTQLTVVLVFFAATCSVWSIACRASLRSALTRSGGAYLWIAPLLGVLTFAAASLLLYPMTHFLGLPQLGYLHIFDHAGYGLGLATLFIAVEPAVFEELAFRGVIVYSLRQLIGRDGEVILVSAAMFAIIHLSIPSFPHLLVMGTVLAWLRLRSGSLYPGMILHFTHNFLCLFFEQHHGWWPW